MGIGAGTAFEIKYTKGNWETRTGRGCQAKISEKRYGDAL
jgi:hypothetical protein